MYIPVAYQSSRKMETPAATYPCPGPALFCGGLDGSSDAPSIAVLATLFSVSPFW